MVCGGGFRWRRVYVFGGKRGQGVRMEKLGASVAWIWVESLCGVGSELNFLNRRKAKLPPTTSQSSSLHHPPLLWNLKIGASIEISHVCVFLSSWRISGLGDGWETTPRSFLSFAPVRNSHMWGMFSYAPSVRGLGGLNKGRKEDVDYLNPLTISMACTSFTSIHREIQYFTTSYNYIFRHRTYSYICMYGTTIFQVKQTHMMRENCFSIVYPYHPLHILISCLTTRNQPETNSTAKLYFCDLSKTMYML